MGVSTTTNNIFPQAMPDLIGNYIIVDDVNKLPDPSGGKHTLSTGFLDFVDNKITGLPPILTNHLNLGVGQLIILNANKTLNSIVYSGTGAFIRADVDAFGVLVQTTIVYAPTNGTLYDIDGEAFPGFSTLFGDNYAVAAGDGFGSAKNFSLYVSFNLDHRVWTTPSILENISTIEIARNTVRDNAGSTGVVLEIRGEETTSVLIDGANVLLSSGQEYLCISPTISKDAVITISSSAFNDLNGGLFFRVGTQGTITVFADNSSTGSITAFVDNGSGGTTVTSSSAHGLSDDRAVTISGTPSYNGTFEISVASGSVYDIPVAFVADDATGTWNFNSVTVTSAAHGLSNGDVVQIDKSTNYNVGREIFGVLTNSYDIDNIDFNGDDAAGEWDSGSLKQDDGRMTVISNGDQPNTAQLYNVFVSTTELITITDAEQFEPIISWIKNSDRQFTLNPPGESVGGVRYDGKAITARVDFTVTGKMVSGGTKDISLAIFKKPDGGSFSQVGQAIAHDFSNKNESVSGFISGMQLFTLDIIELRISNKDDTTNINIDLASCSISAQAQGF